MASHEVESEVELASVPFNCQVLGGGHHVPFAGEVGSVMGRTARDEVQQMHFELAVCRAGRRCRAVLAAATGWVVLVAQQIMTSWEQSGPVFLQYCRPPLPDSPRPVPVNPLRHQKGRQGTPDFPGR